MLKKVPKQSVRSKTKPKLSKLKMPLEEPQDTWKTTARPMDLNNSNRMDINFGAPTTLTLDMDNVPRTIREQKEAVTDKVIYGETRSIFDKTALQGDTLKAWASKIEQQGIAGLENEFMALKRNMTTHPTEAYGANPTKNRYNGKIQLFLYVYRDRVRSITVSDVRCWDKTRVKLKNSTTGDYIHANYVDGYNRLGQYICAQGPLDGTVEDFWRMVWQEKTVAVIMLMRLIELMKVKCAAYFPEVVGLEMHLGELYIKTTAMTQESISDLEKITVRKIVIICEGNQREIKHIHYTDWPDRGVPSSAAQFICLLAFAHRYQVKQARRHQLDPLKSPIVIHCSAGIGRTGTLVAVDVCREHLKNTGVINVMEVVKRLREHRANSVQTEAQYVFIHRVFIEWCLNTTSLPNFNWDRFYSKQLNL